VKIPKCFRDLKESEYLGDVVGNGTLRKVLDKVAVVRDCSLPKTQKQI
jgi:hypothetical protein